MSPIKASLDEIVEAIREQLKEFGGVYYDTPDPDSPSDANFVFVNMFEIDSDNLNLAIEAALEKFVVVEEIPFDKALDRASLNAFDRMEFIKGANWAKGFLTTPKKGGDDEA